MLVFEFKTSGKPNQFAAIDDAIRTCQKGTRDLNFYQPDQIKRVRLVKRADGYYAQSL